MSTRKPSLKTGDLFQNQYRIKRVLGSGGHAFVYAARDEIMGDDVALKLIEIPTESGDERRRRACTEAKALKRLDHPNVVHVFSAGATDDGWIYIVMALLGGRTLRATLHEQRMLDIAETLEIAAQIADGAHAAHQAKIIHRDLKPENIVLEPGNKVILIDFGVAKLLDPDAKTTQRDLIQGTVQYLSPEQLRGHSASPRSDIFALGVVIYEMLTGTRPALVGLTEINVDAVVYRQLYEQPPKLPTLREDVPAFVDRVVQRMLEKDPNARFQTMADVATALRKLIARLSALEVVPVPSRDLSRAAQPNWQTQTGAVLATVPAESRTLVQTTQRLALVQVPPEALPTNAVPAPPVSERSSQSNAPNVQSERQPSRLASIVQRVSTVSFESATPAPVPAAAVPASSEPFAPQLRPITTTDQSRSAWWDLSSVGRHPLAGRVLSAAAIAGMALGVVSGMLSPSSVAATPQRTVDAARAAKSSDPAVSTVPPVESFKAKSVAESPRNEVPKAVPTASPEQKRPPTPAPAAHHAQLPVVAIAPALRRSKPSLPKPAAATSVAPVASAPEPKSWIRVRGDDDALPSSGLSDVVSIPWRSAPASSSSPPRRVPIPAKP